MHPFQFCIDLCQTVQTSVLVFHGFMSDCAVLHRFLLDLAVMHFDMTWILVNVSLITPWCMDLHQTVQASISALPGLTNGANIQCSVSWFMSICAGIPPVLHGFTLDWAGIQSGVVWIHIGLCKNPSWCCVDSHWTVQESILVLCGFTLDCASVHYSVVWIHIGLCKRPL